MKGLGFIVVLTALIIVAVLTIMNVKKSAAARKAADIELPEDLKGLPGKVKGDLDKAVKDAEERTKKALEAVE